MSSGLPQTDHQPKSKRRQSKSAKKGTEKLVPNAPTLTDIAELYRQNRQSRIAEKSLTPLQRRMQSGNS
jgi:superfamily I DNA/RNA helicase